MRNGRNKKRRRREEGQRCREEEKTEVKIPEEKEGDQSQRKNKGINKGIEEGERRERGSEESKEQSKQRAKERRNICEVLQLIWNTLKTSEANKTRLASKEIKEEIGKNLHYNINEKMELELHAKGRRMECDRCEEAKKSRGMKEERECQNVRFAQNWGRLGSPNPWGEMNRVEKEKKKEEERKEKGGGRKWREE